ncbi:MAG: hypothetical protein INR66_03540 [Gordonia polyisoprenivorans]|nr:hypothetical protein [Gordonia polyisoprenivorans]
MDQFLTVPINHPGLFPVTSALQARIAEIVDAFAEGSEQTAELMQALAFAVSDVEIELVKVMASLNEHRSETSDIRAYVLELESRLHEAGVQVPNPPHPLGRG